MITKSEKETIEFASEFASRLHGGEVLVLTGDLGGGKTTFVQGLAKGMRLKGSVTSPTFVILQIYKGRPLSLYHFDLYRVKSSEELLEAGFDDFVDDKDSVVVIEWGEKFPDVVPDSATHIVFKNLGGNKREIVVRK